jgi:hypothetical protein
VTEAVGCSWFFITVEFEAGTIQQVIKQLDVIAGEKQVGRLRVFDRWRRWWLSPFLPPLLPLSACFALNGLRPRKQTLINAQGAGHTLAMTYAALATHFDF